MLLKQSYSSAAAPVDIRPGKTIKPTRFRAGENPDSRVRNPPKAQSSRVNPEQLGSTLFIVGVQFVALGVIGDILAGMRVLQQRVLERVRRVELHLGVKPSHYEPGAKDTGQAPTTGADAGPATGKTEDREALKL